MRFRKYFTVALLVVSTCGLSAQAQTGQRQQDEQAIRRVAQEYLAALARGDAKAMGELWTANGDVVDEAGRSYPARSVILAESNESEAARPVVKLTGSKIRFLTSDVALEDGTSEVSHPMAKGDMTQGAAPLVGRFTVIWVKQDGNWRLASLRETRSDPPATAAQLAELDWLTGDWTGENGDTTIDISTRWNETHTFLLRDLKVLREGHVVFSGTQRVGWDPATRTIKSWVFDTDGGHGEGTWTKVGDRWLVQGSGVLANGQRTTSTNEYSPESKDAVRWRSSSAQNSGQSTSALDIQLVRKPAAR
jgi:uncharacterized protein (TIGR02246 family)